MGIGLLILGGVGVAVGAWFLVQKAAKPEPISRADFYAELVVLKAHIHAGHLAILEKLDANHRELLATLERQGYSMRSSSWPVSWPASGPVSWTIRTV